MVIVINTLSNSYWFSLIKTELQEIGKAKRSSDVDRIVITNLGLSTDQVFWLISRYWAIQKKRNFVCENRLGGGEMI